MTRAQKRRFDRHVGVPVETVAPTRAPSVKSRTVSCPDCKALIGQQCISTSGKPKSTPHVARRRMAIRAMNQTND